MFALFRPKLVSNFSKSFPKTMESDVDYVLSKLAGNNSLYNRSNFAWVSEYQLENEIVCIPRRYLCKDISRIAFSNFSETQKQICCCIFLVNTNGYIREKYLKKLLQFETKEFMLPFLMNISGDYVKEILQSFYENFRGEDKLLYKNFCNENKKQSLICYSRMLSYWNEYYRFDIVRPCVIDGRQGVKAYYKDYVGYKLFRECFDYSGRRKD